ncbi:hypothetical protein D3C86_974880 [compost metagenome]
MYGKVSCRLGAQHRRVEGRQVEVGQPVVGAVRIALGNQRRIRNRVGYCRLVDDKVEGAHAVAACRIVPHVYPYRLRVGRVRIAVRKLRSRNCRFRFRLRVVVREGIVGHVKAVGYHLYIVAAQHEGVGRASHAGNEVVDIAVVAKGRKRMHDKLKLYYLVAFFCRRVVSVCRHQHIYHSCRAVIVCRVSNGVRVCRALDTVGFRLVAVRIVEEVYARRVRIVSDIGLAYRKVNPFGYAVARNTGVACLNILRIRPRIRKRLHADSKRGPALARGSRIGDHHIQGLDARALVRIGIGRIDQRTRKRIERHGISRKAARKAADLRGKVKDRISVVRKGFVAERVFYRSEGKRRVDHHLEAAYLVASRVGIGNPHPDYLAVGRRIAGRGSDGSAEAGLRICLQGIEAYGIVARNLRIQKVLLRMGLKVYPHRTVGIRVAHHKVVNLCRHHRDRIHDQLQRGHGIAARCAVLCADPDDSGSKVAVWARVWEYAVFRILACLVEGNDIGCASRDFRDQRVKVELLGIIAVRIAGRRDYRRDGNQRALLHSQRKGGLREASRSRIGHPYDDRLHGHDLVLVGQRKLRAGRKGRVVEIVLNVHARYRSHQLPVARKVKHFVAVAAWVVA